MNLYVTFMINDFPLVGIFFLNIQVISILIWSTDIVHIFGKFM